MAGKSMDRRTAVGGSCLVILLMGLGIFLGSEAHQGQHTHVEPAPARNITVPGSAPAAGETLQPIDRLLDIYECTKCHRLTTPHRLIGPSLWKIGERADAAAIRASILTPDASVAPGYPAGLMQTRLQELGFYEDIKRQPALLERLVAYLVEGEARAAAADPLLMTHGMLHIPSGFAHLPDGQPIELPGFHIDAEPVTTVAYEAFMAAEGYTTKRYWDPVGWAVVVRRRHRTQPLDWQRQWQETPPGPVLGLTWYEADAYCRWLGKILPTEVQWQRACAEVPTQFGAETATGALWEWTAEAVWKGGRERCTARMPSYPALDGRDTGFRCASPASP